MKTNKQTKVVLAYDVEGKRIRGMCPMCGYALIVDATVRLNATREIGQMPIDYEHLNEVTQEMAAEEYGAREEAERHG